MTKFLLAAILSIFICTNAVASDEQMLPDAIIYPGSKPGHILVTDKAEQVFYLYSHDGQGQVTLEKVMPCSTGENKGDKLVEGDKKTPNGYYIFNQKLLPRELSPIYGTLAYPTNYPNFWDKKLGRGGYGIWIHGINKPLVDYDSNGCVELENADIAQMEELIHLYDTPLLTYEALAFRSESELRQEAKEIKNFIESWRKAWVTKNHQAYKSKYAPDFINSDGRSFSAWMGHKESVAKKYKSIQVNVNDLRIFRHRDVIVAVFDQDYRGDNYFSSMGLKRLYIQKIDGLYKIVAEEFENKPISETNKWLTAAEKRKALETPPITVAQLKAEAEGKRMATEEAAEAESLRQARAENDGAQAAKPTAQAEDETISQAEAEKAKVLADEQKAQAEAEAIRIAEAEKAKALADEQKAQAEAEAIRIAEAEKAKALADEQKAQAEAEAIRIAEAEKAKALADEQKAQAEAEKENLEKSLIILVQDWAAAWRERRSEDFLIFYHQSFHYQAKNLDYEGFKAYRGNLIRSADIIEVDLSDFKVDVTGDTAKVSFIQNYRSDSIRDLGRKTLTLKKTEAGWKIVAETWKAIKA